MCSADSCSRMYRLVFGVSAVEAAVRDDLKQLMALLTLIQRRVGKLVGEHGETLPCAPHCLWLLAWVERNDKPFSLHVLFACTSLCIYFPDLLYLDGLYFFVFQELSCHLEVPVWCILFLCPASAPRGVNAGGGDAVVLAGGVFLQHPLLGCQQDLPTQPCWRGLWHQGLLLCWAPAETFTTPISHYCAVRIFMLSLSCVLFFWCEWFKGNLSVFWNTTS